MFQTETFVVSNRVSHEHPWTEEAVDGDNWGSDDNKMGSVVVRD